MHINVYGCCLLDGSLKNIVSTNWDGINNFCQTNDLIHKWWIKHTTAGMEAGILKAKVLIADFALLRWGTLKNDGEPLPRLARQKTYITPKVLLHNNWKINTELELVNSGLP